ncbi:MAG: glutathione binding-like protein [Caulobacteraceae bacterium]
MISESFFLLEYLEDAFPGQGTALKLGTPYGDWQVQVWGRFVGERAAPAVSTLGCHKYLVPALKEKRINSADQVLDRLNTQERKVAWAEAIEDSYSDEVIEESRRKAGLLVERIEKALETGDWLVENTFTAADIDAFAMANSLPKLVPDAANKDKAPRFMAWLERMRARPLGAEGPGRLEDRQARRSLHPRPRTRPLGVASLPFMGRADGAKRRTGGESVQSPPLAAGAACPSP